MARVDPGRLTSLLNPWLRSGPGYSAVADGVRGLALDGRLPAGTRLPSERGLAVALGVSRTTVSAAYDVLRTEGYLVSAHGAGSRVALPAALHVRPDADPGEPASVLDLTVAALPAPPQVLEAATAAAATDLAALLADHGMHPYGLPALRSAVAAHLTGRGVATDAEQVLVTGGALQAWNLLLRTLTTPGQRVVVEQPTYPAVIDAVRAHHLRPVALPVTADGWDPPSSSTARGAVLAHVTADGQNPTGLLASAEQRRELLAGLRGVPLVAVDETFADLVDPAEAPPRLAAVARRPGDPAVVTLGSMSKSFWAGLRVGWVRGEPELLARLAQARASLDITSPVLEQLVAVRLLAQADAVLAERRALLAERRDALLSALARGVPDWVVRPSRGGLVLWVLLPTPGATLLAAHALDLGVRLSPGPRFTVDGTGDRWLRVPFTTPADGVTALVDVLREARARAVSATPTDRTPARWTA